MLCFICGGTFIRFIPQGSRILNVSGLICKGRNGFNDERADIAIDKQKKGPKAQRGLDVWSLRLVPYAGYLSQFRTQIPADGYK